MKRNKTYIFDSYIENLIRKRCRFMNIGIIIAAVLISLAIGALLGIVYRKKVAESKIHSAEEESKKIVNMARIEAENLKKAKIIEAKEEIVNSRNELDQEIKERRGEVQRQETRLIQKEENLERRAENYEKKEESLNRRERELEEEKQKLDELHSQELKELQRIASLSKEDAKNILLKEVEKDITAEKAAIIREANQKAKDDVKKNAKELLKKVKSGEAEYHFIEIMGCPGGCVNGGGQPQQPGYVRNTVDIRAKRAEVLYNLDKKNKIRKSHENPAIIELYDTYLGEPGSHKAHELLHTTYVKRTVNK